MSAFFVNGASGLIGRTLLPGLLPSRVFALSRQRQDSRRIIWLDGDIMSDGLALSLEHRRILARNVTSVIHLAGNNALSQTIDHARAINTDGTRRLLELTADWPRVTRWVYVSSAFVAGFRTGRIVEADEPAQRLTNAFEESKAEAERLVRATRRDWTIVRLASIACDDVGGHISQFNALHRLLRLSLAGLTPASASPCECVIDAVTAEHAARGISVAATSPDAEQRTLHVCAGAGAMPFTLARTVGVDSEVDRLLTQLTYAKSFDTSLADALLGPAPPVHAFWPAMVSHLMGEACGTASRDES